jgi:hypothetical protein
MAVGRNYTMVGEARPMSRAMLTGLSFSLHTAYVLIVRATHLAHATALWGRQRQLASVSGDFPR